LWVTHTKYTIVDKNLVDGFYTTSWRLLIQEFILGWESEPKLNACDVHVVLLLFTFRLLNGANAIREDALQAKTVAE